MPSSTALPAELAKVLQHVAQEIQEAASGQANLDKCVSSLGSLMQQHEAALAKHRSAMAALAKQGKSLPADKLMAKVQEQQEALNAQLLKLQAAMQRESQMMTTISNVMKTRHETVKNSISNIR